MSEELDEAALKYHRTPTAGKLAIVPTKPMTTQRDLSLAYSPGVAAACTRIVEDPAEAATLTARANLVGVISNGSAVLGLGNIGPLAAKPVMEGKAVLFKKFSDIDVFDIEINQPDAAKFIDTVASLEPTFGGINLEDIKAPECFEIEHQLRERMSIPVFHDDQHGTAIIVTAAVINGLRVTGKAIEEVRLVTSGAGAAALSCLNQLISAGLRRENIIVTDSAGVIYSGRQERMDRWKQAFARDTQHRTLSEALSGADVFLGLSVGGLLRPEMLKSMAPSPLVMALANPDPEILPEQAREVRPDAIIATGRSDYPNQVNNVLCFPFVFRGALDVGATTISDEMKLACVHALASLATKEMPDDVRRAYDDQPVTFGPDYLIPKPFDPRLIFELAPAVAQAAMDSGVATRPIADLRAYQDKLRRFVFRTSSIMQPIVRKAQQEPRRMIFSEGESIRVLHACQELLDDGIAQPIVVARQSMVEGIIQRHGLRMNPGQDLQVVDPECCGEFELNWRQYHELMGRKGVTPGSAQYLARTQSNVIAGLMLRRGDADGMICGVAGGFRRAYTYMMDIIGKADEIREASTLMGHILHGRNLFISDAHLTTDPSSEDLVQTTLLCAEQLRSFGIEPKVALLSHSNFGTTFSASAIKVREAVSLLHQRAPELEVDGEMHADAALSQTIRNRLLPDSRLRGSANLLIMPNADAANIAANLLKEVTGGVTIGPIMLGMARPVHVVNQSISVRGLVNMSAIAVHQAQELAKTAAEMN